MTLPPLEEVEADLIDRLIFEGDQGLWEVVWWLNRYDAPVKDKVTLARTATRRLVAEGKAELLRGTWPEGPDRPLDAADEAALRDDLAWHDPERAQLLVWLRILPGQVVAPRSRTKRRFDGTREARVWPPYVTRDMTPSDAIAHVLRWLDTSPSEEMLGRAALTQLEPLVDWHWREVEDDLLGLLEERADLRSIVRDCVFDDSVPDEVAERLYAAAAAR